MNILKLLTFFSLIQISIFSYGNWEKIKDVNHHQVWKNSDQADFFLNLKKTPYYLNFSRIKFVKETIKQREFLSNLLGIEHWKLKRKEWIGDILFLGGTYQNNNNEEVSFWEFHKIGTKIIYHALYTKLSPIEKKVQIKDMINLFQTKIKNL